MYAGVSKKEESESQKKETENFFEKMRKESWKKWRERWYSFGKIKNPTMGGMFTIFFSSLLFAAVASYELFIMGIIVALEGYAVMRHALESYAEHLSNTNRKLLQAAEVLISIAALVVIVGGTFLEAGVLFAAAPFVFMGIMAYRTGHSIFLARDSFSKRTRAKDLITELGLDKDDVSQDSENTSLIQAQNLGFKTEEKDKILLNLISNTLQLAHFALRELLLTPKSSDSILSLNIDNLVLKNRIIDVLNLDMDDDGNKKLTLADVQKQLIDKINNESKQCIVTTEIVPREIKPNMSRFQQARIRLMDYVSPNYKPGLDLLNKDGTYNDEFFNKKPLVKNALEQSASNHLRNGFYFAGLSVMFALGGVTIAGVLSSFAGFLGQYAVPIVAATTGAFALNTIHSAYNSAKSSSEKEVEMQDLKKPEHDVQNEKDNANDNLTKMSSVLSPLLSDQKQKVRSDSHDSDITIDNSIIPASQKTGQQTPPNSGSYADRLNKLGTFATSSTLADKNVEDSRAPYETARSNVISPVDFRSSSMS